MDGPRSHTIELSRCTPVDADAVVIGAGPAGLSAALWCRRLGLRVLVLEQADEPGGQVLDILHPVGDYLGAPAPDGRALAAAFARQVREAGVEVRTGTRVTAVTPAGDAVRVEAGAALLMARRVIVASGARPRRLGVPGEAEMIARGEVWRGSRDRERFAGLPVAVVGGGDRAVQNALFLAEAGADVTLIHRSRRFRARRTFLEPALAHPRIRFLTGAVVRRILGHARVEAVEVGPAAPGGSAGAGGQVPTGTVLPVAAVFVYIGMEPNTELLGGRAELDGEGGLRVDRAGRASLPGVYAAGDVCTPAAFRSIPAAVGQGMVAAKAVALELLAAP